MNGLNGLDFVGVALLALGAIYGLQRGALRMVTSVVALAAAIYFASIYYNMAGAFAETKLGSSHTVGAIVGYVVVFALIFSAVEIIGSFAIRLIHVVHMNPLDRLAGGLLGAGNRRRVRRPARNADGGSVAARRGSAAQFATGADAAGVQRDAGGIYPRRCETRLRAQSRRPDEILGAECDEGREPRAVAGCVALALHEKRSLNLFFSLVTR